jgi:hypothetical protein
MILFTKSFLKNSVWLVFPPGIIRSNTFICWLTQVKPAVARGTLENRKIITFRKMVMERLNAQTFLSNHDLYGKHELVQLC